MLTHHEPSITDIDFASLSPEEQATVVQAAIRRAHAERAEAFRNIAKRLFSLAAFRGARGANPATPPKHARHA